MARDTPFRLVVAAVLLSLVASGLVGSSADRQADPTAPVPDWLAALEGAPDGGQRQDAQPAPGRSRKTPGPATEPATVPATVPLARSVGVQPATVTFPPASRWSITPGGRATGASPAGRPVTVTLKDSAGRTAGDVGTLDVEVHDRAAADRAGASGFVFTVRGAKRSLPAEVGIDYSGFADAYGAGYADRLRVAAIPGCALVDPRPAGCAAAGTQLPTRNDRAAQRLVADVADLSAVSTFAVLSDVGGDEGTFAATPLSVSGSWQVSPASGAFTYSYPVSVTAPAGGSPPTVALSYSSAAVDGMTLASNTQASPSGLGWSDFANAYIERRYDPCFRQPIGTADLCWKSDNATISLNGVSGALIPINAERTEWRVQSDPGWRIERLTGAPYTTVHQGQHWKVTGVDGTQYFFGSGHMPGQVTNSILGVQVVADNSGEPCRAQGDTVGGCEQGWRWYLDRVVDPDGNVTSYVYAREDNWYHSLLAALGGRPMSRYHRGALLKEVYYGGRGWDPDSYAGRVTFGLEWRCGFLVAECPAPTAGHGGFPDVPTDLICDSDGPCSVHAPSFFTGRRYAWVRTAVRIGTAWRNVAQHNLIHSFGTGADGVPRKLQIDQLQHAGVAFDKLDAYPTTKFTHQWLDNRADHGGQVPKAMRHNRIAAVTTPFGGTVSVSYFRNRGCAQTYNPYPRWDKNVRDCFPQSIKDGAHLRTGVFNKYLVRSMTENPGTGSPASVTTYTYEGDPAWAFDTGAFARDEDETGWSVWRGYGTATITKGTSKNRIQVYRGWNDDPTLVLDAGGDWIPFGRRTESITAIDGSGSYVDHPALAGRTLVEQQLGTLNGTADTVMQSRRHEYEIRETHDPGDGYYFDAEWVGLRATTESVASAPGVFRHRRSQTAYNQVGQALRPPQPTSTLEEGWLDVDGDERCSVTTYADNPSAWMFVYPAMNRRVAGSCTGTQVLSQSETFYDGSATLGAAPVAGNPTRQRTLVEANRWSETTTAFDDLGRPVQVTDLSGGVTTTAYTVTAGAPASQLPIRITVTNPLGHLTVTDLHPEFGVPKRQQDVNGNAVESWYDAFGRLTAVWLPTEPVAFAEPSVKFTYDVANRRVRTDRLVSEARVNPGLVFETSWTIYDGFWRERQQQTASPAAGRILVTETTYDDRGQVRDELVEQAFAGTLGTYVDGGSGWANRTRHSYDELGREVRKEWLRGGAVAHTTTTQYGVDSVTVTGPDGRRIRERIDGLGRTVAVEEFDGQVWAASTYTYDLADRLLTATDPAANRIAYAYNLAGWRTGQQDPNRGYALFAYDNAGNQTVAADASGAQLHTRYDALGRPTERRSGSATGPLLATWQYDTAPGGKGQLHRETAYAAGGNWVTEVLGYDNRGRETGRRFTVPLGVPGLSGSYVVGQTYDRAGRVSTVTLPAIGGLPAEELTTTYNTLGLPTRLAGLTEYVWNAVYDDRGRRTSAGFGPRPGGGTWMAKQWTYNVDQQLAGSETYLTGPGLVADHELAFDPAGNLSEKLTRQNGLAWRECFGYDGRNRLTAAHTVTATQACAAGTPGTGDRPYAHEYRYSPDGRLTERVENGVSTWYTYPAAGSPQPHAPTRIGTVAYTWDARGSLATRAGDTYSWDVQGLLLSVASPTGTTSFTYDAAGQRLLRRTPDGRVTLYLGGHEITVEANGAVVSAVRPYVFDGQLVATRTASGVEYVVSDPAGSVELTVPSGQITPSATRAYEPYGQVRAQDGEPQTDRGFIAQIEDASTGLTYLNARYYDAAAGVFISTDPIYDTAKVKTMNPYGYATNNPSSFADPSGLYSVGMWGLEVENAHLKQQNKELIAHIGKLANHIEHLQDVIRKQQKSIKKLISHIHALEAVIARQASIIRSLQARVAQLERVVAAQRREISRLRHVVARQEQFIRYQAGVISYYKGVVNVLGFRLWGGTPHHASVMNSIHSFRGIPAGAFDVDRISGLSAENARLRGSIQIVTDLGLVEQGAWDIIDRERANGFSDSQIATGMGFTVYVGAEAEAQAVVDYGSERYDVGYDAGYDNGKAHKDWGDFAQATGCYVAPNVAGQFGKVGEAIGFVIETGCYLAEVGG